MIGRWRPIVAESAERGAKSSASVRSWWRVWKLRSHGRAGALVDPELLVQNDAKAARPSQSEGAVAESRQRKF